MDSPRNATRKMSKVSAAVQVRESQARKLCHLSETPKSATWHKPGQIAAWQTVGVGGRKLQRSSKDAQSVGKRMLRTRIIK